MSKAGKCCKDCRFFRSDVNYDECVEGIINNGDEYGVDVNAYYPACSKFKEFKENGKD